MPLPADFEKQLWDAADQLWTNTSLKPSEYATPVLALIFLRYADLRFAEAKKTLEAKSKRHGAIDRDEYHAMHVVYVPDGARYDALLRLPEGADVGKAVNAAMKAIEDENEDLKGALPRTYGRFEARTLKELLKTFGTIPADVQGDVFGRVYEYFLGALAPKTLQKGGEYFTPYSVVRLIVEIIEPFHGRILDPACGSGGMFVQSAKFVAEHKKRPMDEISICGVERIEDTLRLAKINFAVHGLSGDIKKANSYYDDPHDAVGRFDFVMANPPFNQPAVDKDRIKDDKRRYPFGMPAADNANYLWISLFYSALAPKGRAGFVMANGTESARGSEMEMRKKLLATGAMDVIVSLTSNLFYTVTLPATLWFLDRAKATGERKEKVLFIDAGHHFRQVDRAHREMTPDQVEFLGNIVRLFRGEDVETRHGSGKLTQEHFPKGKYADVAGLCKVETLQKIEAQGWSLNPGRYVGVAERQDDGFDFKEKLAELNEQLEALTGEARTLEARISKSVAAILECE